MTGRRLVAVLSSSQDRPNVAPVVAGLEAAGCGVVVVETDRIANGTAPFAWELCGSHARMRLSGTWLDLDSIDAAWWRKPQWLGIERSDAALQLSLEREMLRLTRDLWSLVADSVWLNSPTRMRESGRLAVQLATASRLGFATPRTLVTNSWREIDRLGARELAFKVLGGGITEAERTRVLYTQRLDAVTASALTSNPFPGIIQNYVEKRREWRVTVVDDEVFCASVYSTDEAANDWREHQLGGGVRFAAEEPPAHVSAACSALVEELGLGYAAIDLIETPEGEFVFLEANPNGQYGWLEEQLGLGISAAIVRALARRASTRDGPRP